MDELIRQVMANLAGLWQKRWFGLAAAWLAGVAGIVIVLGMPDKYEASARIYVDTQSTLKPLMSGITVQPNVEQQVAMLSRTLISRPNMEKLVRMADLDLGAKSKEDKEQLVDGLVKTLEIKALGRDNLYTLAYRDTQPERAKRVVQSLVSIFVEAGLGDKRKDGDTAMRFIEEQIHSYEKKLEEAERRLKEFKLKNLDLAEEGKNYFSRIGEVAQKLNEARLGLREAENARDSIKRSLAGEEPSALPDEGGGTAMAAVPEIDSRIDALKRNLDGLLQRYTEQHPDVIGARKVIAQLDEQKRQELAARKKAGGGAVLSSGVNPYVQQLKVSLTEAEANVASLRARVGEYEARANELKNAAKMQPEIEAEFTQLNRDYDVIKSSYQGLVTRRESASMSEQMESTSGLADFRMIDPPRVSPNPVAPNRLLILPLALAISLVLGAGVSFVVSQLRPTFLDRRSLGESTGLPVLGSVSLLKSDAVLLQDRRRLKVFLAALIGLLASYGAALAAVWLMTSRSV